MNSTIDLTLEEKNQEQYELRQRLQKARFEAEFCLERIKALDARYKEQFEPSIWEFLVRNQAV